MTRQLMSALVLLSAIGFAQAASAQGKDKEKPKDAKDDKKAKPDEPSFGNTAEKNDIKVVSTSFLEAYQAKNWETVEDTYEKGFKKFEKLKKKKEFIYRYCVAVYNLADKGKKKKERLDKVTAALEDLIDDEPRYISAIYLLAKCLAKQKKPTAKDYLDTAAKLGFPVLREISDKKNAKLFGHLLEDPRFIVKIMKAGRNSEENISEIKNPFVSPIEANPDPKNPKGEGKKPPIGPIGPKTPANDAARIKLESDVDNLFNEIEDLIERSEYDGLLTKFKDLNGLMNAYSKIGSTEIVQRKLEKWKKISRDRQFEEVQVALQLQVFVNQGNQILRAMATSLQKEEFEKVFQGFQKMSSLVDRMRSQERDAFTRNAEALFYKAKELNDKAIKKKRIQELKLRVTGIVLDSGRQYSDRQSGHRAIINDKIYAENQAVTDQSDEPIPDLIVLNIFEGSVRFKYQNTTFDRALNPIDENNPLARKKAPAAKSPTKAPGKAPK
ncbi:MAG: hypothetical protein P1V97_26585 [Planctomycetota bacterium]|nr:hypothetical protein [Planctomycetota bacterium]